MDVYNIYRDTSVPWWRPFKFRYKITRNGATFNYTSTLWGAKLELKRKKEEISKKYDYHPASTHIMIYEEQA